MKTNSPGIRLDWRGADAPHGVLDLLRGCNAACEGCYNGSHTFAPKPAAAVRRELRELMKRRRLHTISLTGGEPLLHPELDEIIRDAKSCGLRTVLMTNAVLLDAVRARRLQEAGADMLLMHIQTRQHRPDLRSDEPEAARRLRREKAAIVTAAGMDAGWSTLMYPDDASRAEIRDLLAEVLASESVHFAMVCPQGDFSVFADLGGGLVTGLRHPAPGPAGLSSEASVAAQGAALDSILHASGFGLFAWIGSSRDLEARRWSAWNAGVLQSPTRIRALPLSPTWTDRVLLRLVRLVCGRHLFHLRANPARLRLQLALSLLGRGGSKAALALLAGSCRRQARLWRKHVVIELPPAQCADGSIVFCRECPDATWSGGRLVPPCLADRMSARVPAAPHFQP